MSRIIQRWQAHPRGRVAYRVLRASLRPPGARNLGLGVAGVGAAELGKGEGGGRLQYWTDSMSTHARMFTSTSQSVIYLHIIKDVCNIYMHKN